MEQRAIEHKLLFYPRQSWVSIDDVNPNLLRAIIAMEDGSFFMHKGIDWKELENSMQVNKRRRHFARGGSTLTMQLAKNLFLTTAKIVITKRQRIFDCCENGKRVIQKSYTSKLY